MPAKETQTEGPKIVKCKVQVHALEIDVDRGIPVRYYRDDIFECSEERAKSLMNSVKIL